MTNTAEQVVNREHHPLCDSRLGPEFEVKPGRVEMTIHVCVGYECLESVALSDTNQAR